MRRNLFFFVLLITAVIGLGCGSNCRPEKKKDIIAKVNDYEISAAEFEEEFQDSPYSRNGTIASRQEFLKLLINRKLILQDAEKEGLHKDKEFLRMIERFWEQSLLKLALEKKSKEVVGSTMVSDKTVEATYQQMVKEGKTTKPYDEMYSQIKRDITKLKETQAIDDWMDELHKNAMIKVNYELLKKEEK